MACRGIFANIGIVLTLLSIANVFHAENTLKAAATVGGDADKRSSGHERQVRSYQHQLLSRLNGGGSIKIATLCRCVNNAIYFALNSSQFRVFEHILNI